MKACGGKYFTNNIQHFLPFLQVGGRSCSRGTVLKLFGVPTIYDIIEEAVMVTSSEVDVGSMDFLPGHVVHVRLLNEGDAYLVMKNLADGEMEIGDRVLQATVLEGEEEEAALKKAKKVFQINIIDYKFFTCGVKHFLD